MNKLVKNTFFYRSKHFNMQSTQNAVVTAATKGIGRAVVYKLAEQGMSVAFCARNAEEVQQMEQALSKKYPLASFLGVAADVAIPEGREHFVEAIKAKFSQVHLLLNNAGIFLPGSVQTEAEGVLEKLTETNVYSAYHITRGLLPLMLPFKSGHLFNMCSTASITAYTNGGSYCITKFALLGMSKVLREELKPELIKVTSILPGATYTASWEGSGLDAARFMKAEDVADMLWACYQLSPAAVVEEILLRPLAGDIP
jgi:short-subunit dehydrogenase